MTVKEYTITEKALKLINTPAVRRKIQISVNVTEFTVARWIQKKNAHKLLQKPALDVIIEMTGLKEAEIYKVKEKKY